MTKLWPDKSNKEKVQFVFDELDATRERMTQDRAPYATSDYCAGFDDAHEVFKSMLGRVLHDWRPE